MRVINVNLTIQPSKSTKSYAAFASRRVVHLNRRCCWCLTCYLTSSLWNWSYYLSCIFSLRLLIRSKNWDNRYSSCSFVALASESILISVRVVAEYVVGLVATRLCMNLDRCNSLRVLALVHK